jgi:hypothetical protein
VEVPSVSMLSFVANQIGTDPRRFGDYARRGETRREHLIELQKLLHLRSFRLADWRGCLKVGSVAAWATDRGEPIVHAMLSHLRATNVLLPAATVLEEGAIMTVQHIADLEPARRTAILVAQVANLETRLTDAALAMFEKYVGSLFTKAQNRDERRFQANRS